MDQTAPLQRLAIFSLMDEWEEEYAVGGWTRVVKLLIIQEWVRGCLFVVRWWNQRLPLGY